MTKSFLFSVLFCAGSCLTSLQAGAPPQPIHPLQPLFNGSTLEGWEGNPALWRVQDGALSGGSYETTVKENEFLATTRNYTNFVVRMKIRLTGKEGFINSGFQIRSQRVPKSSEMAGYQCDFGDPDWYGAIYDESRRNKVMSPSDMAAIGPVIKRNEWNDYVIRAEGPRITTWINGVQATDYIEQDPAIADFGRLGIQVHGGGKALAQVKELTLEELPVKSKFVGAADPGKNPANRPLTPEEEQKTFSLPPGFEIELVASESEGIAKFVTVDWDQKGRMWAMTALEYPVDANESPEVAKALYASRARDKVLVWDTPSAKGPQAPRVFADGLAIPLGILPYKNGVYVQHGTDLEFRSDTDGDGSADKTEVILSGFGVQDSHLFPHQFTRGPGNWLWMAQGAFNYGKIKTSKGVEQKFDQTRMARFRADGSEFDITSQGPCNIWGLVLTREGESFIQEANDYGYPMMPFHAYANYPGCSDAQFKSYAPEFPGTAPDFQMGGTGLSGLALSDAENAWPAPYNNVFYLANPITRKIQAIEQIHDGPRARLHKLPDFIQSSDEMFRPVSIHFGPDGCLYIVDWYNKIISHNEVARNHPDRDKKSGRIWRVSHQSQKRFPVPDFTTLSATDLLAKVGADSIAQSHLAWQTIADKNLVDLAPRLKGMIADVKLSPAKRIAALWALEGLHRVELETLVPLLKDANRHVRREAIRAFSEVKVAVPRAVSLLGELVADEDPQVRSEIIRTAGAWMAQDPAAIALGLQFAQASLEGPMGRSTQSGKPIRIGIAYEREFERYLVRLFLEQNPGPTRAFLNSPAAAALPAENRMVAALALEPKESATRVAALLGSLKRSPNQEEMLRLMGVPDATEVQQAVRQLLQNQAITAQVVEGILKVKNRFDAAKWETAFSDAARTLWKNGQQTLVLRIVSSFKLASFEKEILQTLQAPNTPVEDQVSALRALSEIGTGQPEVLARLLKESREPRVRTEALNALSLSRSESAAQLLIQLWPELNAAQRRTALAGLVGSKAAASKLVLAIQSGAFQKTDLDRLAMERLVAVLPGDAAVKVLADQLSGLYRPVLHLDGHDSGFVESDITLGETFTVEAWMKLAPGIDNNDGLLGAPGVIDMNFYAATFRVWVAGLNDVVVAKKKMAPESWTHLAVSRGQDGKVRIYLNGELDAESAGILTNRLEHLKIGWTAPSKGTEGDLSEFRVWNRERTPVEIRAWFDRALDGQEKPAGLQHHFSGATWEKLQGTAKVIKTDDFPLLLSAAEAKTQEETFDRFRSLALKPGEATRGKGIFGATCLNCHSVGGTGGQVGPVLNGAGAMGLEGLLRATLTPNAAMEAGYRVFRVELRGGDVLDGRLISQDKDAIVLRQPNREDQRIALENVVRAGYTKTSLMPEGLLDAMPAQDVSDLFSYLKTLK